MPLLTLDASLLEHLAIEFGDHGRRAVDFLLTAQALLELESQAESPRLAETVAYCLREAMKTIPASQDVTGGGLWRTASRAVIDARRRYELARGVPGEDEQGALGELLVTIDELESVHAQEGIHERRLIAIMVNRTGALPVAAGTEPIRAYQDLLQELDEALHGDATLDGTRELWKRCAALLRQLFLPPELRHAELDSLASVESVTLEDVERLLPLIAGPNHLRHFLSRVSSPEWLEALTDSGVLDPPDENGPWPVFAAVDRLAPEHGPALADWLDRLYGRHASDPARAWFIARAAVDIGTEGAPTVVRALHDHGGVPSIAALGVWAVEKVDPESELAEQFADVLLNEASWRSASYMDPVVERLVDGLDDTNAMRRLQLLCWKLRRVGADEGSRHWFGYERAGSIADWTDDGRDDRFTVLLRALVVTVRFSQKCVPVNDVLGIADSLPDDIRGRVRALVLAESSEMDIPVMVDELAKAIAERDPTGDDLLLLDRILARSNAEENASAWARALGPAPSVVDVARQLSLNAVPPEWLRAFRWIAILPEGVAGQWAQPASVMAAAYGRPTREALEKRRHVEFLSGRSPISPEELESLSVGDATARISAWRPDPSEWLVSARELARTMEEVMKRNPAAWIVAPLRVATDLRHPTYVHHYLQGIAAAVEAGAYPPVDETLDVIGLVRAHPWSADPLGEDDFDFDHDWEGAEQAGVEVIKALADKDVGFGTRADEAWAVLEAEARDRGEPSGIISGARDPLDSAINRRCTRALEAALSFMAHEFRSTEVIRPSAFSLLEDALRLEGGDGAEHRAIVATRLGFLRYVAPDWVDEVAGLLFGDDAPEGLAQVTADLVIKWSRPNRWFLEHYRNLIRSAVTRGSEHALEHLMIAMLWEVPGYTVDDNVSFLRQTPEAISKAGETLGRLLRHRDADDAHIALGVAFWDAAISTGAAEALPGFGWFAEIAKLDDETWARRTVASLEISGGRIDWSHKVAERAASLAPSTTTLAIINSLVRGASDEWDRRGNIERAVEVIRASDDLAGTPGYERLRTTLLERGAL